MTTAKAEDLYLRNSALHLSPSDLNTFLACEHATGLNLRRARGEITLRKIPRPDAELVAERGQRHEEQFLASLIADGYDVTEIVDDNIEGAARATEAAMCAGAEVIYQAAFDSPDGWRGYADFLIRIEQPSDLGGWSYEVHDTKLAKHPKPYFIVQLAFYTEQVARIQGRMPDEMHIVLGTTERASFRYVDFAAYVRRVRSHFLEHLENGAPLPYPYPVEHCAYCDWWRRCIDKRRADDHLSLVANLGRDQAVKLEDDGVRTVRELGELPAGRVVKRLTHSTLEDLRLQASLQLHTRDTGEHVRRFLPLEDGRGFFRLPAPSKGDVFFDIEGDPYWGDAGLEYLLGSVVVGAGGRPEYSEIWAHDAAGEKRSFEQWIDWVTERRARYPDLHIYHYNHYETTALKRLMSLYGSREAELDALLRDQVFVDLYAIVRQSMRVGEESYSLKQMEHFYPLERDAEVTEAGGSILAYQEWLESGDEGQLRAIAEYNADDCRSTLGLYEWLRQQRVEAEAEFDTVLPNRDAVEPREPSEEGLRLRAELDELEAALVAGLPEEPELLDADGAARRLLADLLEYHRREEKPQWWAYFDRLTKTPAELAEHDSEAIGQLEAASDMTSTVEKQSRVIPLRYPPQQHKIGPGEYVDPVGERGVRVVELDDAAGVLWIKRAIRLDDRPLPRAIVPPQPIPSYQQQDAVRRLARRVIASGLEASGDLDAGVDLLTRRPPRIRGHAPGSPLQGDSVDLEVLKEQVASLEQSALFVQGPPGSGKTWTGARLIVDLMRRGMRVGVTATSHKAIHNMLEAVEKAATEDGLTFRGLKKASDSSAETHFESRHIESSSENADFPPGADVQLVAGTPWLFARENLIGSVDVLFVDEAGQVALADAIAVAQAAGSVVLLGDPQQLAHVGQGTHPRGAGASVLQHLLGDAATVPPGQGVFLDKTWRMHPDICGFVSEAMYDGRLESAECCTNHLISSRGLTGTGIRYLPVEHDGDTQQSPAEGSRIAKEVAALLDGGRFVDSEGVERALSLNDILVVAPYNAQVRLLHSMLPSGARVGTVDKFQGQEAPIVFFSMTSSSGEDVPRGMDFLFSRNRLNVAVSRAQCLAVVVSSPRLAYARCNSVEQMRLVNALCRFIEMAAGSDATFAPSHPG